jgi:hypothetical protein
VNTRSRPNDGIPWRQLKELSVQYRAVVDTAQEERAEYKAQQELEEAANAVERAREERGQQAKRPKRPPEENQNYDDADFGGTSSDESSDDAGDDDDDDEAAAPPPTDPPPASDQGKPHPPSPQPPERRQSHADLPEPSPLPTHGIPHCDGDRDKLRQLGDTEVVHPDSERRQSHADLQRTSQADLKFSQQFSAFLDVAEACARQCGVKGCVQHDAVDAIAIARRYGIPQEDSARHLILISSAKFVGTQLTWHVLRIRDAASRSVIASGFVCACVPAGAPVRKDMM